LSVVISHSLLCAHPIIVLPKSRADFWVAIGNAAIKAASPNQALDLPFRYGRNTTDSCSFAIGRLPLANSCDDVEGVFLDRMGLSWRDATALLGAHTIGGE